MDFSPDGKQIAFQDFVGKDSVIAVENTEGSGYRAIAQVKTFSAPIGLQMCVTSPFMTGRASASTIWVGVSSVDCRIPNQ